jgi:hypothetical protein
MHPAIQQCTQCGRALPVEQDYCPCGKHLPNKRLHPTRYVTRTAIKRLQDGTAWQRCTVGHQAEVQGAKAHHHSNVGNLEIDLYTTATGTSLIITCVFTGRQYVNATLQLPIPRCIAVATTIAVDILLSKE